MADGEPKPLSPFEIARRERWVRNKAREAPPPREEVLRIDDQLAQLRRRLNAVEGPQRTKLNERIFNLERQREGILRHHPDARP